MNSEEYAEALAKEDAECSASLERAGYERRGAAMWVRPPQAADAAPVQPDAQAEAPQRTKCYCGPNSGMCAHCLLTKERTIDTSDAEPWPDEALAAPNYWGGMKSRDYLRGIREFEDKVMTAPAEDVPADREGE